MATKPRIMLDLGTRVKDGVLDGWRIFAKYIR
jgi:hypothetical protein